MKPVGRLLGLDIGDVRIGVAVSDELGVIASPVATIPRAADVVGEVRRLTAEYGTVGLVSGLPVGLSGREGPQAGAIREYADWLAGELGMPLEYADERLSTSIAERTLTSQRTRRAKRKQHVDAMAAAVILQGYLDRLRHRR